MRCSRPIMRFMWPSGMGGIASKYSTMRRLGNNRCHCHLHRAPGTGHLGKGSLNFGPFNQSTAAFTPETPASLSARPIALHCLQGKTVKDAGTY